MTGTRTGSVGRPIGSMPEAGKTHPRRACIAGRSRRRGFTFAEVLAAMVFLAIVIPAATQGALIASRVGEAARRQRQAARLADRLLAEKIVTGEWDDTEDEGDFGDDWPEYRWTLETAEWTQPDAIQVGVTVYFTIQGREQSVRVATLIDETAETESSS